ncbi:MAG: histidinol-phosphate transaminase [Tatlockia sp.]|nr:histidinol-phosphate transaminase [Tatlockia sp.]
MSVLNLIRRDLIDIKKYSPKNAEFDCRLHANELPWSVLSTCKLALNRYPELEAQSQLQLQLAELYQISSEQILITRGSDDAIDFLMRFFLHAREDSFMQCSPTFPMYEFYARLQQIEMLDVPLSTENSFKFTAQQLIERWRPNCKLIMLCNPNNPTASLVALETIADLCQEFKNRAIIVVDEAYIEFTQTVSATTLLDSFDNLIVLRTLSKAYGLAGLRLGAMIAQPQLIEALQQLIPPYILASPVIQLARKALSDKNWFQEKIKLILAERDLLTTAFKRSPWIDIVFPSQANFIFLASSYAQQLVSWFAESKIAIRYFEKESMQHLLRISIGNPQQNQNLLTALSSFNPLGARCAKNIIYR